MEIYAGTSGYSYKEWKGSFYPEKLAAAEMLRFYAKRLGAVEVNNTFYRMPKRSVLESWAAQVPEGFRFAVKASRRITHFKRLKDAGEELGFLLGNLEALGQRLGVVLFQLPPNLKKDRPRLEAFLERLPQEAPAAFEFRHPSWTEDDEVAQLLADRGVALCRADSEETPLRDELPAGRFGYLRLRRAGYADAELADFAERIRARGWQRAFVFFKHEDEGAGPKLAQRFNELSGEAADRRRPRPVRRAPRREQEAG
jgi:uncharacterized protein YecE (DUF72 family)